MSAAWLRWIRRKRGNIANRPMLPGLARYLDAFVQEKKIHTVSRENQHAFNFVGSLQKSGPLKFDKVVFL